MDLKLVALLAFIRLVASRDIELESFKPSSSSDQDLIDYSTLRISKVSKNHFAISGDFSLKKNVANEKTIVFEVFKEDGDLLLKNKRPLCDFFKDDRFFWPGIIKASNMPQEYVCPFPKGNYTITNFVVDEHKFAMAPAGKYLAKMQVIEDGKILTSVECDASVKD